MFTIKVDNNTVELKTVKPTPEQKMESDKIKNKVFRKALTVDGAFLKQELKNVLRARGLWSDEVEENVKELEEKITSGVQRLNSGGFDIEEAKNLAFSISKWRTEMIDILSVFADNADMTAEGQADNAAFDYLVSCCAVYNDSGKPFFENYQDYLCKKEIPYSGIIASEVYKEIYGGVSESDIAKLPEYQFLLEFKFIDEKLRRIDSEGRLIDAEGRLIDEDGNLINANGDKIDRYGNLLDENGSPIINRKPFLKNGEPISG